MSVEQQLREYYREDTADVVGGPDLGNVLDRGRRRRRTRLTGVVGGAAAFVAVGAVVTASLVGGGASTTVSDPHRGADPAAGPRTVAGPEDFVAGTDTDDTMAQVIADHLAVLGAPEDVYPSDWYTNGPIPDADFADATDWQAAYPIGDGEHALVLMGYPKPGEPAGCPDCSETTVPQGVLRTQVSHLEADGEWLFMTSLVRDDGFTVSVIDYVTATRLADATGMRSISDADAGTLVRDPRMQFPAPSNPPTGP